MLMLNQHMSSAQQLLHLAHTQAQQMLSSAYEQAQQLLVLAERQQFSPPPLMSVCKVHHRPGCSLTPCSHILYNRSKVNNKVLQAELVRNSRQPKTLVTNINTKSNPRRSPAQNLSLVMKSKLPV